MFVIRLFTIKKLSISKQTLSFLSKFEIRLDRNRIGFGDIAEQETLGQLIRRRINNLPIYSIAELAHIEGEIPKRLCEAIPDEKPRLPF